MGRPEKVFRAVVSGALAYEAVALQVDRLPTITCLCDRFPPLKGLVVGWLTLHFHPR